MLLLNEYTYGLIGLFFLPIFHWLLQFSQVTMTGKGKDEEMGLVLPGGSHAIPRCTLN